MKVAFQEKNVLAEATANLIESLHQKFPGIKTEPIAPYEDEDFTLKVTAPSSIKTEDVEEECNRKCIEIEDKFDAYILTKVVSK